MAEYAVRISGTKKIVNIIEGKREADTWAKKFGNGNFEVVPYKKGMEKE